MSLCPLIPQSWAWLGNLARCPNTKGNTRLTQEEGSP